MDEHQAGVDQVKCLCGQWIGANVMALDLNRRVVKRREHCEKARVDIGDQDMAGGAAALSKPYRNRPTTTADFPAPPTCSDSGYLKVADGP